MNTPVIEMDQDEAAQKAIEYEASRRRDPETLLATRIYQLLEAGKRLVDVGTAIREAGFFSPEQRASQGFENGCVLPKLAIARADRKQVKFEWRSREVIGRFDANNWRGRQYPQLIEGVNFNTFPGRWTEAYALVPMVPADVCYGGYAAAQCHILWEVERWSTRPLDARPPRDPYLLRRVEGDLFEVLAEWELTEVERYVMAGRARVQS